jgi:hypothetical protein
MTHEEPAVTKSITITLTEDEAEIIVDALENDRDSYIESADDARKEGDRASAESFREAAKRISAVLTRIQSELGE